MSIAGGKSEQPTLAFITTYPRIFDVLINWTGKIVSVVVPEPYTGLNPSTFSTSVTSQVIK